MNGEPIRGRPARNVQNLQIVNLQATASAAVDALIERGFTVLRVVLDGGQPMIWIQNCGRCSELGGVCRVRRRTERGPERIMAAPFQHCQVQWTVAGH